MKISDMRNTLLILLVIIVFSPSLFCQRWNVANWGIHVGFSAAIGTHIRQVGIKIQGYYRYQFVQVNAGNSIRFNRLNLGERKNFITQRINTGIVLLAGKRNSSPQLILSGLTHQSKYDYGLAYNYLWYLDNIGTSQRSGGFGFHIQQVSILFENDIFAGSGRDRFRTSLLSVLYHNNDLSISINSQLWTGETRGPNIQNTPDNKYLKGYKDLRNTLYGRTSHGIISVGISHQIIFGNTVSALIGYDSERIRNFFQNKLVHNQVFLPKAWRKPNTIYPMLDEQGFPVHEKEKAAKGRFYFQLGLNSGLTY